MTPTIKNKVKTMVAMALLMVLLQMPCCASAASQAPLQGGPCCKDYVDTSDQPGEPRQERFSRERFMKDLRDYITREANLSSQEASAVFPLYFEMKAKMHDMQERINRSLGKAAGFANERDCQRTLTEISHMRAKQQKVEAEFMKRIGKVVSSQKLVRILVADQNFGRARFRQMMDSRSCGKRK